MSRVNRWAMRLWPVAPLLIWIQRQFDVDLETALSMLVGHVKACRMNMSSEGWPYTGFIAANSRTQIRDFVDFAWPLGLRVEPLPIVAIRRATSEQRKETP